MTDRDRILELRATLIYVLENLNDWAPVLHRADFGYTRKQLRELQRCVSTVLDEDAAQDPGLAYPGMQLYLPDCKRTPDRGA